MFPTVTVVILLSQLPFQVVTLQGCVPNRQFFSKGLSCPCDSLGQWQEADCQAIQTGQTCQPDDIIMIGCSRCICEKNNHLACDYRECNQDTTAADARRRLHVIGPRCTPFKSYYVNCSVCVCSASGKTTDAQCVRDTSCSLPTSTKRNICLPKVLYLFPCLHCVCSDTGYFERKKCVEVCQKDPLKQGSNRCKPNKLYRKDCNVCLCPDNGLKKDLLCSNSSCHNVVRSEKFKTLQGTDEECLRHSFTKKKCIYCECTSDGKIDEDVCIEAECLKLNAVDYGMPKPTCTAGEIVPFCTECFCLSNRTKNEKYCSKSCSYRSKFSILEKVLEDNSEDNLLINQDTIEKVTKETCRPNLVFLKDEKYCLCDDSGVFNENLCRTEKERVEASLHNSQFHKLNTTCKPSTFVEFDCNTCFCSKNGTIDPKWCTYDDCDSKKFIEETHKTLTRTLNESFNTSMCIPGTISKEDCNFCICSESGLVKERACTKNHCEDLESLNSVIDKFICEPLSYYEVDCNICFCPRDGLKNVSNCTRNTCEKNFLRSNVCVPGQLFIDTCNVCVCPPNGDKNDKACTKNSCPESTLKRNLAVGNHLVDNVRKRNLGHCFPGEEFFMGCKLCVCPDMGLKAYATCNLILCDEEPVLEGDLKNLDGSHSRRNVQNENYTHYHLPDVTDSFSPPCHNGSTYIVK